MAALAADAPPIDVLLEAHARRIGLEAMLEKERVTRASQRAAFTVASSTSHRAAGAHAGSDESSDDGESAASSTRRAVSLQLSRFLRTAEQVGSAASAPGRGGGAGRVVPALERLKKFIDDMNLALYDPMTAPGQGQGQAAPSGHAPPVVVTTIHQAKGMEWDLVFACHLEEGSLPLLPRLEPHSMEYVQHFEEERRLAYVACTRARRKLVVTFCEGPSTTKARRRHAHRPPFSLGAGQPPPLSKLSPRTPSAAPCRTGQAALEAVALPAPAAARPALRPEEAERQSAAPVWGNETCMG